MLRMMYKNLFKLFIIVLIIFILLLILDTSIEFKINNNKVEWFELISKFGITFLGTILSIFVISWKLDQDRYDNKVKENSNLIKVHKKLAQYLLYVTNKNIKIIEYAMIENLRESILFGEDLVSYHYTTVLSDLDFDFLEEFNIEFINSQVTEILMLDINKNELILELPKQISLYNKHTKYLYKNNRKKIDNLKFLSDYFKEKEDLISISVLESIKISSIMLMNMHNIKLFKEKKELLKKTVSDLKKNKNKNIKAKMKRTPIFNEFIKSINSIEKKLKIVMDLESSELDKAINFRVLKQSFANAFLKFYKDAINENLMDNIHFRSMDYNLEKKCEELIKIKLCDEWLSGRLLSIYFKLTTLKDELIKIQ